ncbi:MAG: hypothetical protein IT281_09745 [Ignavibacteria bacterium]|nr:hypothetical protein [Ignavibacteria bacterium]MCC7159810.1 hypothetical protein [Ignavibacteria bacterium]
MTAKIISLFIIVMALNVCYCQTVKKTNLEILEQDISAELEKFFFYPDVNRDVQFVFFVRSAKKDKSEKKFIESVVKKTASKNNLKFSFSADDLMQSSDSIYNKVWIDIIKLNTDYPRITKNKFLSEKFLERDITSELAIGLSQNINRHLVTDRIITSYKDEIPYDDYPQFETEEYKFTQSIPPNISLIETIIFPAAIVMVSAVATILFFTIRSK